jgi:hypothetical protein
MPCPEGYIGYSSWDGWSFWLPIYLWGRDFPTVEEALEHGAINPTKP